MLNYYGAEDTPPHPLDQHAWITRRQKELEAQYIREGTFRLTAAEERLLAQGIRNARKRHKIDFLQRKHDTAFDVAQHDKERSRKVDELETAQPTNKHGNVGVTAVPPSETGGSVEMRAECTPIICLSRTRSNPKECPT